MRFLVTDFYLLSFQRMKTRTQIAKLRTATVETPRPKPLLLAILESEYLELGIWCVYS